MPIEAATLRARVEADVQKASADFNAFGQTVTRVGQQTTQGTQAAARAMTVMEQAASAAGTGTSAAMQGMAGQVGSAATQAAGSMRAMADTARQSAAGVAQLESAGNSAAGGMSKLPGILSTLTGGMGSSQAAALALAGGLGTVATAAVAAGAAFMGSAVTSASNLQQALADLRAGAGASVRDIETLRNEARRLGPEMGMSATQVVKGWQDLAKAGVSTKEIVGGVGKATLDLTRATGESADQMSGLMVKALTTFKLPASEAARVADLIAKSTNASVIDVNDFALSLAQVGPVAKMAGLTIEEVSAVIGILGNNALKGSDAGTSLKTFLLSLAAPTEKAKGELQALNVSLYNSSGAVLPFENVVRQLSNALRGMSESQKASTLETIFGTDAIRAGLIITNEGRDGLVKFKSEMDSAAGVAEQAAIRQDTLRGSTEKLKAEYDNLKVSVAQGAVPALTELVRIVAESISAYDRIVQKSVDVGKATFSIGDKFKSLIEEAQKMGQGIAAPFREALAPLENLGRAFDRGATQAEAHTAATEKSAAAAGKAATAVKDAGAAASVSAQAHADAVAPVHLFADIFDVIYKKGNDVAESYDAARKALHDFATTTTDRQQIWNVQTAALDSVAKSAQAAFSSQTRESVKIWTDRAREMVDQTKLAEGPMDRLRELLGRIEKGGPGAAGALAEVNKIVSDAKKPIGDAADAERAYAKAQETMLESLGKVGPSLETLAGTMKDFVATFQVSMGIVPAAAKEAMTLTKDEMTIDLGKPGADVALKYANGFRGKTATIVQEGVIVAQGLASALDFDSFSKGAAVAEGFAAGIRAKAILASAAAADLGGVAEAALSARIQAKSPSRVAAQYGMWFGEGFAGGLDKSQAEMLAATADAFGKVLDVARASMEILPQLIDLEVTPDTTAALQRLAQVMRTGMGAVFAEFSAWNAMGVQHVKDVSDAGKGTFDAFSQVVDVVKALADLDTSVAAAEPRIREMARLIEAAMGELFHATVAWNQIGVAHVKEVSEAAKATFEALSAVMETLDKVRTLPQPNPGDWLRLGEMAVNAAGVMAWLMFNVNDRTRKAAALVGPVADGISSAFGAVGAVIDVLDKVRTLREPQPGTWLRIGEMAVEAAGVMAWLAFNINDRVRRAAAQVGPVNDAIGSTFDAISSVMEVLDKVRTLREPQPGTWLRIGEMAVEAVHTLQWVLFNLNKDLAAAAPMAGTVMSAAGTVIETVGKVLDLLEPLRTGRDLTGQDWDRIADAIHVAIASVAAAVDDPALTQRLRDAAGGASEVAAAAGTVLETIGKILDLMEPLRTSRAVNGQDWVRITDGLHVAIAAVASAIEDPAMTQALRDGAAGAGEVMSSAGTILDTVGRVLDLMEPLRTARTRSGDDWPRIADAIHVAIASVASVLSDPEMSQELRDGATAAGSVASAAGTVLDAVGSVLDTLAAVRLARVPDPADVARLANLIEIGVGALAAAVAHASQDLRDGATGASSVASAAGAVLESVRGIIDTFRALDTLPADAINPDQLAAFVVTAAQAVRDALAQADDQLRAGAEDAGKVAASATAVIGSLKALAELFDASRTVSPTAGAEMARALVAQSVAVLNAFLAAAPDLKAAEQRLISEVAPAIQSVTAAVRGVLDLMLAFASQATEKTQEAAQTASKNADGTAESLTQSSRAWERTWTSFDLADRLRAALPAVKASIQAAVALQFEILQQFQDEMASVDRKGLAVAAEVANSAKAVQDAIKGAIDLVMGLGDVIAQSEGRDAFDKYATALQSLRAENARQMEDLDAQISQAVSGGQVEGLAALNRQRERAVQDFANKQAALERQLFADQSRAAAVQQQADPRQKVQRGIENLRAILDQVLTAIGDVARDYQARFAGQQQLFADMAATVSAITASITGLTNLMATLGDDTTSKTPRIMAGAAALPGLMVAVSAGIAAVATIAIPDGFAEIVEAVRVAMNDLDSLVARFSEIFVTGEGLSELASAWFAALIATLILIAGQAYEVEQQAKAATAAIMAAIAALRETIAALGALRTLQSQLEKMGIPTSPVGPGGGEAQTTPPGFAGGVTNFVGGLAMGGTSISSHAESMSMLRALARGQRGAGAGGSTNVTHITVPVTVTGPVYGIHDLNAQIQHAVKEGVRTGAVRDRAVRRTG